MKKAIVLLLAAAVMLSTAACADNPPPAGSSGGESAPESQAGNSGEVVELRYLFNTDKFDPETDYTRQRIEELLNVRIIPEMGNEEDKVNLILSSGQEYDMIKIKSPTLLAKYIKNKAIQPLSESIEKYGPNITAAFPQEVLDTVSSNGQIYALPEQHPNDVEWGVAIREDWLNALDMPMPTTPDEFYQVLKAFKEQDPGNVGKDKVIPFAAAGDGNFVTMNGLAQAFGLTANPCDGFVEVDGKLVSSIEMPQMKDYLSFLNKLYAEGLLDIDFPATKGSALTEKISSGVVGSAVMTAWESAAQRSVSELTGGSGKFVFVPPLTGANGERGSNTRGGISFYTMVPASSKKVNEVIQYCNAFLAEENYTRLVVGEENESYKIEDGKYVPVFPGFDKLNKGRWFIPVNSAELYTPLFSARAHKEKEMGELYDDLQAHYAPVGSTEILLQAPMLPENEKYGQKLKSYAEESMIKMVIDANELNNFDAFVAKWKADGGDELTQAYNNWYQSK